MKRYLILIMMLINVIIVCAQQKTEVKYYMYTLTADEKKPQEFDSWQKVRFYAIINKDTITLFEDEYGNTDGEDYVYRRMHLLEDKIHTVGEYQYAYFKNLAGDKQWEISHLYMFDIRGGFSFIDSSRDILRFFEYRKYSVEEVPYVVTFKEITREEFNKADAEFIQKKGTINW